MNLEELENGDRVRSVLKGWGTIGDPKIEGYDKYVFVEFDRIEGIYFAFFQDGRSDEHDVYPEIIETVKKKIEIEGGEYLLTSDGWTAECVTTDIDNTKKYGRTFKNKEQAQAANDILTPIQRLLRFAMMFDSEYYEQGIYQTDHSECNGGHAKITWDCLNKEYRVNTFLGNEVTNIPMPEDIANELCLLLNKGQIEL